MSGAVARYEEVRFLGEALARYFGLDEAETRQLLELMELFERSNAEPPGEGSRHAEYTADWQAKMAEASERVLRVQDEFSRVDTAYWNKDRCPRGEVPPLERIPLDDGEMTVNILPDSHVSLCCKAPVLLEGSLTLVLPKEVGDAVLLFRQRDRGHFVREFARTGNLMRMWARTVMTYTIMSMSRPEVSRTLYQEMMTFVVQIGTKMSSVLMTAHPSNVGGDPRPTGNRAERRRRQRGN